MPPDLEANPMQEIEAEAPSQIPDVIELETKQRVAAETPATVETDLEVS